MKLLLKHAHLIIDGNREFIDGAMLIDGETISDVYPQSSRLPVIEDVEERDLQGLLVMPGFFDTHTHGIAGMSFDDADQEDMN